MPKFKPGQSGNPATKFQPGQSGNPAGKSAARAKFGQVFIDALAGEGSPEEAAKLVWQAARKGEAWAIQLVYLRLAPPLPKTEGEVLGSGPMIVTIQYVEKPQTILVEAARALPAGNGDVCQS